MCVCVCPRARALCNIRAGSGLANTESTVYVYIYIICGVLHEKRSRNWLRVLFAPAVTREGHMSCNCAYRLPFAQIVFVYLYLYLYIYIDARGSSWKQAATDDPCSSSVSTRILYAGTNIYNVCIYSVLCK
jgi:hypothetical protein